MLMIQWYENPQWQCLKRKAYTVLVCILSKNKTTLLMTHTCTHIYFFSLRKLYQITAGRVKSQKQNLCNNGINFSQVIYPSCCQNKCQNSIHVINSTLQNIWRCLLQHFSQCFQVSNKLLRNSTQLMPNRVDKHTYHLVKVLCHCTLNRNVICIQLQHQQPEWLLFRSHS